MKPQELVRFSVSMDGELVGQLDAMSKKKGYANRSQAMADGLIAIKIVKHGKLTETTTGKEF